MKTIEKYICAVALSLLIPSCNYLDSVKLTDEIETTYYWENATSTALEKYCNFYYPRLVEGFGDPNSWNAGKMFDREAQSDNLYVSGGNAIRAGNSTKATTNGEWSWTTIRGCNDFLKHYRTTAAPKVDQERFAAEIKVFKAWDYFNKVKVFGDVPWYDEPLTTQSPDLYKGRDSRFVVMDSVLSLLNQAIPKLFTIRELGNRYRITKNAALALKARICLYEGTWRRYRDYEGWETYLREAYDAAGELMKPEYGHYLYTEGGPNKAYFDLFIQDSHENNNEIILSREYSPGVNMGHQIGNTIPLSEFGMSRSCYEEYLCSKTGQPISLCACHKPYRTAAKDFYIPEMKDRDMRLLQTICLPEKGSPYAYYLYREDAGEMKGGAPNIYNLLAATPARPFYGASCTGYSLCKFFKASENGAGNMKGGIDAPVFRFAETLLIRAEAAAELGLDPELDKTINLLRTRVGFPFKLIESPVEDPDLVSKYTIIKGSNANLIREIRRERRIEMFAEGLRWDDVCRWDEGENLYTREHLGARMDPSLYTAIEIADIKGKVGFNTAGFITPYVNKVSYNHRNFKKKFYLFNIPINEVSLNPNLLPQNPGWE